MTRVAPRLSRAVAFVLAATAAVTAGLAAAPFARAAHASSYAFTPLSSFDAKMVAHINKARANHGLGSVIVAAGTTDVAHGWSCHQADYSVLAHNGNLGDQLASHGSSLWTFYAENVGMQPTTEGAAALFKAYMHSPEHRANILDPSVKFVGVWTKKADGTRYNTIDFVGSRLSSYDNDYGAPRRTC